ncbi:hypothetical protein RND81_08G069800 [Saponaria officinalis]|uniref:Ubiquitin-like domain-containing protein n=1 Tax=Saponaria officinalis TaxID=3572 RepID=A0AAW1J5C7_SAPOF
MASEVSGRVEAGSSEATIEIKIKTMDSQTYTLQVDKQMPVPALKECIASVTGVVTDRQRLICRGKVLRDDQLLSAYHVEDGHTLHLVVREPAASSSEGLPGDSAFDRSASGNHGRIFQVAPNIVLDGERGLPDIGRLVSAVLGSMGVTNNGGSNETMAPSLGTGADTTHISPEQPGTGNSYVYMLGNPFGIPGAVTFGSDPPVIPDAIDTLSQYSSRMRQEFLNYGNVEGNNDGASSVQGNEGVSNALPTPALLAELLSTTRQMLNQIAEECLPQLARQLENHENLTNSADRAHAQVDATRSGVLFQNLGAYFLELGRTIMTLRLGRSPSEAVVNAGPAVFVSPAGPNPLMVQPLPFQPGPRFGTPLSGNLPLESELRNLFGPNVVPRPMGMDMHVHRVPLSTHQTETAGSQQSSGQRISPPVIVGVTRSVHSVTGITDSPSVNSGDGSRVLSYRNMTFGIPNTSSSPPEAGSLGFLYSLLGRSPNLASGNQSSGTDSQVPGGMQNAQSTGLPLNVGDSARTGRAATASFGQRESRTIDIDILSRGGIPSDQNVEALVPPSLIEYLRGLYPGSEIQVESVTSERINTAEVPVQPVQGPPSGAVTGEDESRVTMEGLFFSAMLQQLMPLITQYPEIERAVRLGEGASSMQRDDPTSSASVGGSEDRTARQRDDNSELPDPKRQKME